MNKRERNFIDEVKADLEESTEKIDPDILIKLSAARCRAVADSGFGFRGLWLWRLIRVPAAAMMVVGVFVVFAMLHSGGPTMMQVAGNFDDVEVLAAVDSPEFYADLDFYTWLAAEEMNDAG